ncbi:Alpha/Beta hydrolase protein [Chytriomyces sp. MP71]|nr:Alpha/Beta hydrolase protein [Chytriomyces sp. MP71]
MTKAIHEQPFGADFSKPEVFGFSPHRCRNFSVTTSDGVTLGVWHVLPSLFYRQVTDAAERARRAPHGSSVTEGVQRRALIERPVFLYFHGNAGNRAAPTRVATYRNISERLNCNIVAVDYRGFGDSEGSPGEDELAMDARTAYNWIVKQGVPHGNIILLGHSLGTGVATRLARDLGKDGIYPRGLVLQAPYTSIPDAAFEYRAFQVVELFWPLSFFPSVEEYLKRTIVDRFSTRNLIPHLNIPVLLIHGARDREIPIKNSQQLFAIGVAAHRGAGRIVDVHQAPEVRRDGEAAFRAFVKGTEETATGFEMEGRRFISERGEESARAQDGEVVGPPRMMFVELVHAHHNSVQAHDLTYDSIESFMDIPFSNASAAVAESLSHLSE